MPPSNYPSIRPVIIHTSGKMPEASDYVDYKEHRDDKSYQFDHSRIYRKEILKALYETSGFSDFKCLHQADDSEDFVETG